jgi:hypothetical protein
MMGVFLSVCYQRFNPRGEQLMRIFYREAQEKSSNYNMAPKFTVNTLVRTANTQSSPGLPPAACNIVAVPPQS